MYLGGGSFVGYVCGDMCAGVGNGMSVKMSVWIGVFGIFPRVVCKCV